MSAKSPDFDKDTKVRIAVSKFYGMGNDGEWTYERIAEYLDEPVYKVKQFVHESSLGAEAESMFTEKEAQTRMEIYRDLKNKLDNLKEVEEQLLETKKAKPSSFRLEQAEGQISFDEVPNMEAHYEEPDTTRASVPIPDDYEEVADVDGLKDVWREQRQVIEQLEDLLGLEEPDKIEETSEQVIDVKFWESSDVGGDLPDQEIIDANSPQQVEEVAKELPDAEVEDSDE